MTCEMCGHKLVSKCGFGDSRSHFVGCPYRVCEGDDVKGERHYGSTEFVGLDPVGAARGLYGEGYRQTSRKYGIVSRVGVSDDDMREFFIQRNFGDGTSSVPSLSVENQRDHYRRCCSRDNVVGVPSEVMDALRRYG